MITCYYHTDIILCFLLCFFSAGYQVNVFPEQIGSINQLLDEVRKLHHDAHIVDFICLSVCLSACRLGQSLLSLAGTGIGTFG